MGLYEKTLSVVGMLNGKIDQRASMNELDDKFSVSVRYFYNDTVFYNNKLYRCTQNMHYGQWDATHFEEATVGSVLRLKSNRSTLAPEYGSGTRYEEGDIVIKNGELMECTSAGVGASAQFASTTVGVLIKRLRTEIAELRDRVSRLETASSQSSPSGASPTVSERGARGVGHVDLSAIAAAWRPGVEYKPGMMVSNDGGLYCCVESHTSGDEWDSYKWTACTVADVIEGLTSAFTEAFKSKSEKK